MAEPFISKKLWVPERQVSNRVRDAFILKLFDERKCKPTCGYFTDRPMLPCENCAAYKGAHTLYEERIIKNKNYLGFPANNPASIKKVFGYDYWKLKNLRKKVPFSKPIKFTAKLRDGLHKNGIVYEQTRLTSEWLKKRMGIIEAPARSGKTVLHVYIACKLGLRSVVLADRSDLLRQFYNAWVELTDINKKRIKIITKMSDLKDTKKYDVILINYQKLMDIDGPAIQQRRSRRIAKYINDRYSFLTIDECFIAGTKISMADGSTKNIEDVKVGDYVKNATGIGRVSRTFCKESKSLVELQINDQIHREQAEQATTKTITCTGNHPFLTKERGWAAASELDRGQTVFLEDVHNLQEAIQSPVFVDLLEQADMRYYMRVRTEREHKAFDTRRTAEASKDGSCCQVQTNSRTRPLEGTELHTVQVMRQLWQRVCAPASKKTSSYQEILKKKILLTKLLNVIQFSCVTHTRNPANAFRTHEDEQSVKESRNGEEATSNKKGSGLQSIRRMSGWQRHWSNETTEEIEKTPGERVEDGTRHLHTDEYTKDGQLPVCVQSGSWSSGQETSDRSGRTESQCEGSKGEGQEKRQAVKEAWVESVTSIESESGRRVYNLEVEGHPSYFAEGVLVHNCHGSGAISYYRTVLQFKCRYVLGLTATPDRKDTLTKLVKQCAGSVVVVGRSSSIQPLIIPVFTKMKSKTSRWVTMLKSTFRSKKRQDLIIEYIKQDLRDGRRIIIPFPLVKHMHDFKDRIVSQLEKHYKKTKEDFGDNIVGIMRGSSDRKTMLEQFEMGHIKVLIATDKIIRQGIDFKHKSISALYSIFPMSASGDSKIGAPMMYQMFYRVCSPVPGKKQPIVRWFLDESKICQGCYKSSFWKEIKPRLVEFNGRPARYKMRIQDVEAVNSFVCRRIDYDRGLMAALRN